MTAAKQRGTEALGLELVSKMGLPGYTPHVREVIMSLQAPAAPEVARVEPWKGSHLGVVVAGTPKKVKKGRPKKAPPLPWLEGPVQEDQSLDWDTYVERYGLRQYLTDSGKYRVRQATSLWMHPVAREFSCAFMLRRQPMKELLKMLRRAAPDLFKTDPIRLTDLEAFQDLFWDFSGMTTEEAMMFLQHYPGFSLTATALGHGIDAFLFRMGMGSFDISRVDMLKTIQRTAFLALDKARTQPGAVDSREYGNYYKVLVSAFEEEDRYTVEADRVAKELFASAIDVYDAEAIPKYSELLDDIEMESLLDAISDAERRYVITESVAEQLRQRVRAGDELEMDVLMELRSTGAKLDDSGLFGNPLDAVEPPSETSPILQALAGD